MALSRKKRMSTPEQPTESPTWSSTTKLIVGLTFVAIIAALLIRLQTLIGPLILAFILTYLLHPLVARLSKMSKLSWRMSVNVIFLLLVISLVTTFTLTGFVVAQQLESLIEVVIRFVNDLPDIVLDLSTKVYTFGPFKLDMAHYLSQYNLESLVQEMLGIIQPLLGRAGGLVSTLATVTATTVAWAVFILLVTYFVLADAGQVPDRLITIDLPGYDADIRRLGRELGRIWNAFLRGQVIILVLVMLLYLVMMSILGVRYALGIAILAGLSRFIPYIGPVAVVVVTALVAFFQKSNYFGLQPFQYLLMVVIISWVVDQIFDNVVAPRFLGQALGVHPAGVLVAAIVAANLIGLVGLVLAAPALATLNLVLRYTIRKMFDLDPWSAIEVEEQSVVYPWTKWWQGIISLARKLWERLRSPRS
jgi:predicted PurR-regulated permease PerM